MEDASLRNSHFLTFNRKDGWNLGKSPVEASDSRCKLRLLGWRGRRVVGNIWCVGASKPSLRPVFTWEVLEPTNHLNSPMMI